jgi:hypothetical protein
MSSNPAHLPNIEDLRARLRVRTPKPSPLSRKELADLLSGGPVAGPFGSGVPRPHFFYATVAMLTPQQPYVAGRAQITGFNVPYWATTDDPGTGAHPVIGMNPVVSPSDLTGGTFLKCDLTALDQGLYTVVVRFSGFEDEDLDMYIHDILDGSWGVRTGHKEKLSIAGTVTASASLETGQQTSFLLYCTSSDADLSSIEILLLEAAL